MAIIRSILGDITGSAGGLTFSKQGGKNQLRQKVGKNSSNSPAQQDTRARFKLLAGLYRTLATGLKLGFKPVAGVSAYNQFVGENFANTSYDAQGMLASIDYTKMLVSGGGADGLQNFAAAKAAAGDNHVNASWTDNSNGTTALAGDKVSVIVVNKVTGVAYTAIGTVDRTAAAVVVTDARLVGVAKADLMAYGFARRADGTDVSNSAIAQVA